MLHLTDVVSFEVENGQVFAETDVEEVIDGVVRDVELFKLLEGLNALSLFELASSDM